MKSYNLYVKDIGERINESFKDDEIQLPLIHDALSKNFEKITENTVEAKKVVDEIFIKKDGKLINLNQDIIDKKADRFLKNYLENLESNSIDKHIGELNLGDKENSFKEEYAKLGNYTTVSMVKGVFNNVGYKINTNDVCKELVDVYGLSSDQANIIISGYPKKALESSVIENNQLSNKFKVSPEGALITITIDNKSNVKYESVGAVLFVDKDTHVDNLKEDLTKFGISHLLDEKYNKDDKMYEISTVTLGKAGEKVKKANCFIEIATNVNMNNLKSDSALSKITVEGINDKLKGLDKGHTQSIETFLANFLDGKKTYKAGEFSTEELETIESKNKNLLEETYTIDELKNLSAVKNEIFPGIFVKYIEKKVDKDGKEDGKKVSLDKVKEIAACVADKVGEFIGKDMNKRLLQTEIEDVIIKSHNNVEKKPNWDRFKEFFKSIFSSHSRDVENVLKEAKKIAMNIGSNSSKENNNVVVNPKGNSKSIY